MASKDPTAPRRPSTIAIRRLGPIIRGYIAACLTAAVALPIGLLLQDAITGRLSTPHVTDFLVLVVGFFLVTLVAAAPFATAFIVMTETLSARAIYFPLAFGAFTGVVIEFLASVIRPGQGAHGSGAGSILLVTGLVGALSGVVYWAIALRRLRPPAPRQP